MDLLRKLAILVLCCLAVFPSASFAGSLSYEVGPGDRIIVHGVRNECKDTPPNLAEIRKRFNKKKLRVAMGSLAVEAHAGHMRHSQACKKQVPVLPVFYKAPKTKGTYKFKLLGDSVTVNVK